MKIVVYGRPHVEHLKKLREAGRALLLRIVFQRPDFFREDDDVVKLHLKGVARIEGGEKVDYVVLGNDSENMEPIASFWEQQRGVKLAVVRNEDEVIDFLRPIRPPMPEFLADVGGNQVQTIINQGAKPPAGAEDLWKMEPEELRALAESLGLKLAPNITKKETLIQRIQEAREEE